MTTITPPATGAALTVGLVRADEAAAWNAFVAAQPEGHLLQSWTWGAFKGGQGWRPVRLAARSGGAILAGAQVLFRQPVPRVPIRMAYVPRGPVAPLAEATPAGVALLAGLHAYCRSHGAVFLKIEPNLLERAPLRRALEAAGFRKARQVQPRRSITLDLRPGQPEEALLATMKPKTRYNIRLAGRRGVTVRAATRPADLQHFYDLMGVTATRDEFGVHSFAYYRSAWEMFRTSADTVMDPARPAAALLLAEHPDGAGLPLAGLLVFACGAEAIYMYGASADRGREHMASYLLQWEAMRWARGQGCARYDFWGIPDAPEADAPPPGANPNVRQGLWGVYRFKQGFGGQEISYAGAWDFVYHPLAYAVYQRWLARRTEVGA